MYIIWKMRWWPYKKEKSFLLESNFTGNVHLQSWKCSYSFSSQWRGWEFILKKSAKCEPQQGKSITAARRLLAHIWKNKRKNLKLRKGEAQTYSSFFRLFPNSVLIKKSTIGDECSRKLQHNNLINYKAIV